MQWHRFNSAKNYFNAGMSTHQLKNFCRLDEPSKKIMGLTIDKLGLRARAHDRILKVSRTIADMSGEDTIQSNHVAEAIQYRTRDRVGLN